MADKKQWYLDAVTQSQDSRTHAERDRDYYDNKQLTNEEIETGIEAMKGDIEDLLFDNVSDLCASAVRGCIVAPEGKHLAIADLSNIEGRVLAWLTGEAWKVQAFKDYDTIIGTDAKGKPVQPTADATDAERVADAEHRELIAPESRLMLEGVLRMADLTAGDVMVAAPRMDLLDIDAAYDDLLHAVVLRGDPAQVASRLVARFGYDFDRVALSTPGGITDEALSALVTETRVATAS